MTTPTNSTIDNNDPKINIDSNDIEMIYKTALAQGPEIDDDIDYKQKYRLLKVKLRTLLYENELFENELTKLKRELLDIYRDKDVLLKKLFQSDKFVDLSSDSDSELEIVDSSDNESLPWNLLFHDAEPKINNNDKDREVKTNKDIDSGRPVILIDNCPVNNDKEASANKIKPKQKQAPTVPNCIRGIGPAQEIVIDASSLDINMQNIDMKQVPDIQISKTAKPQPIKQVAEVISKPKTSRSRAKPKPPAIEKKESELNDKQICTIDLNTKQSNPKSRNTNSKQANSNTKTSNTKQTKTTTSTTDDVSVTKVVAPKPPRKRPATSRKKNPPVPAIEQSLPEPVEMMRLENTDDNAIVLPGANFDATPSPQIQSPHLEIIQHGPSPQIQLTIPNQVQIPDELSHIRQLQQHPRPQPQHFTQFVQPPQQLIQHVPTPIINNHNRVQHSISQPIHQQLEVQPQQDQVLEQQLPTQQQQHHQQQITIQPQIPTYQFHPPHQIIAQRAADVIDETKVVPLAPEAKETSDYDMEILNYLQF